jgi:hypothetical protein
MRESTSMGSSRAFRLLPLALLLLIGTFFPGRILGATPAKAKVFVFFPSLARPSVIQDALNKACPAYVITVFARLSDLNVMVAKEHPQAIVAQNMVLGQFPEYHSRLQGMRAGVATENYVLLSIEKPIALENLATTEIGVVGVLDRKEMTDFIGGILPGATHINRVTKVEDLLPLLIFKSVGAVFVSEANMKEFQKKSQAQLVATKVDKGKVGLTAVGVINGDGDTQIIEAIKRLDAGTLSLLGVDTWK